jgi:hypothetical protein
VIVRMWHWSRPDFEGRRLPQVHERPRDPGLPLGAGNLSVHILERREGDVTHFITLTFWESLDAIRAFAGEEVEKAKYYPGGRGLPPGVRAARRALRGGRQVLRPYCTSNRSTATAVR